MEGNGPTPASPAVTPQQEHPREEPRTSPARKRRKVNHACIYCRRSERPCTRCVKRNIGHLCHDEPREPAKASKKQPEDVTGSDEASLKTGEVAANGLASSFDQPRADQKLLQEADLDVGTKTLPTNGPASPSQAADSSQSPGAPGQQSGVSRFRDWSLGGQNQFQDMHNFHPDYMFNAPEVTNEYNLLNDFLSTSLLDDGAMFLGEETQNNFADSSLINNLGASTNGHSGLSTSSSQTQLPSQPQAAASRGVHHTLSSNAMASDKARETYYMTAADPTGSDTPEERMEKLLKAKYDAGMLRPFNYVKGYARLNQYMEQHLQPVSRQKILRQLERFRPKFRERMQTLTDIELVLVEMWFERSLMEYDRVFASMAIPACCWRRTGEIFRGNKEMAQLIHVPIERLRDVSLISMEADLELMRHPLNQGKLAIHEIIVEDHLVSYWEKFGAIAFDNTQKAMLTSCSLKNPDLKSGDAQIHLFAKHLHNLLSSGSPLSSIKSNLDQQTWRDDLMRGANASGRRLELDEQGTKLWNVTLKLDQDLASDEIACLNRHQLGLSERIIEKAAFYQDKLKKSPRSKISNRTEQIHRLSEAYYVVRIALAWRQNRLDLAELMLSQMAPSQDTLTASAAEELADILFEIGQSNEGKQYDAIYWLEKAHDVISYQDLGSLSGDAHELRSSIFDAFVRALIEHDGKANLAKAWAIVEEMQTGSGNGLALLLLKLDLLSLDQTSATQDYFVILLQIVRTIHLHDSNIKTTLHHVNQLRIRSPQMAHQVLFKILFERLLGLDMPFWVEKVLIMIIWNCTDSADKMNGLTILNEVFDRLMCGLKSALTVPATHAAQIVRLFSAFARCCPSYSITRRS
ncbi:MAG: hypothetical protein Q9167_001557 [Letrouitia subvulpina]